ncbi:MAG: hypothetical protein JO325_07225 [Solirubrobacterales bacterium]|nr:hypothetical protein [Solirubrobacterales bacterium]
MAALPPPLESSSQRGRAAGIGTIVLGVVIAVAVALLFIVVMGADRGQWTRAGASYRARANPGEIQAAPAALRYSRMPIQSSR